MDLQIALKEQFGLEAFRPGQLEVIDRVMAGRSVMALFPTGGGKSLCYQLPALLLEGVSVVVSPLLALMRDQVDALKARGLPAGRLDSTQELEEQQAVMAAAAAGEVKLLFVSPERFLSEAFRRFLRSLALGLLAVDEAHCVSQWGQRFRPDYLKLSRSLRGLGFRARLALTATASREVERDVRRAFGIKVADVVRLSMARPELALELLHVPAGEEADEVGRMAGALRQAPGLPAIVYARTQGRVDALSGALQAAGFASRSYHAGMNAEAREAVQSAFLEDKIEVVVATIAFGMGVDKPNLRQVIHADLPSSLEAYQQESGRAGRDRQAARALALVRGADLLDLRNRLLAALPVASQLDALMRRLKPSAAGLWFSVYDNATEWDLSAEFIEVLLARLELAKSLRIAARGHKRVGVRRLRPAFQGYSKRVTALLDELADGPEVKDFPVWCKERDWDSLKVLRHLEEAERSGDLALKRGHRLILLRPGTQAMPELEAVMDWVAERAAHEMRAFESLRALLSSDSCLALRLATHFGERDAVACGRCTVCRSGPLPATIELPQRALGAAELALMQEARASHRVLRRPVSLARFLLGLYSPAIGRWRLTGKAAYGALAGACFEELVAQAEAFA